MLIRKLVLPFLLFSLSDGSLLAKDLYVEKRNDQIKVYSFDITNKKLVIQKEKDITTPLGSLWKLFVYAYNKENSLSSPPYTCNGVLNEEVFCCKKGESIDEDNALANSCGLFFSPYRLRISGKRWTAFWKAKKINADWLANLEQLKPEKMVSVNKLLSVLEQVKDLPKAKDYLDKALVRVVLNGTAKNSLSELGANPRLKTFTWDKPNVENEYIGGFGGWLVDGTTIWGMGDGRSSDYLTRVSGILDNHWKKTIRFKANQCVTIRYFHDYKIESVFDLATNQNIKEGSLNGTYRVKFHSGRELTLNSNEELILRSNNNKLIIDGRMNITSYIARVLDREVSSRYQSAAEAFSIVIRSYLKERAQKISGCYHVIDSSKFQRVSANIPTEESIAISSKTSGLILNNAGSVRYHLNRDGKNMISWLKAKGLDLLGKNSQEILKSFYPNSQIVYFSDRYSSSCGTIGKANRWLKEKTPKWHKVLVRHPGYERPDSFKVCKLNSGAPFANKKTNEIFVRGFDGFENQYSIAHEYLHLAFKYHPTGNSERDIDRIAKKLVAMF